MANEREQSVARAATGPHPPRLPFAPLAESASPQLSNESASGADAVDAAGAAGAAGAACDVLSTRASMAIGAAAAVGSAGLWYASASLADAGLWGVGAPVLCAVLVAVAVTLAHRWLVRWHHRAVTRLAQGIALLAPGGAEAPMTAVSPSLAPLAAAASKAVTELQREAQQLAARRREMDLRVRMAELDRSHALAVADAISDGVMVTDAFDEVIMANGPAEQAMGFNLADAMRRPVDEVVQDPVLVKLVKEARQTCRSGSVARRRIARGVGLGASSACYDVTFTHLQAPDGADNQDRPDIGGVVTVLHDVTTERQIAELKTDFVSSVSHELRTPLSSIKAYLEMLMDGEADDEQTRIEFYNIIQAETNRLSRLIENILNISRIESGLVKVQRERISLPDLIHEVADALRPQARAKQIDLVEVPTNVFFQVFADRDLIYQSLLNLIGNAIKYTPTAGCVTVSIDVQRDARMVKVTVTDNGIGIPAQDLPHVFDKFYRVSQHKKLAPGTGLGLNLVKHVIETVHGGTVEARSEVNKGTQIAFSLPLAEEGA